MNKEKNREIKPVSFNLNSEYDAKLLQHVGKTGIKFGTYVKNLIEKDMENKNINNCLQLDHVVSAIDKLTKVIEGKNFSIAENKGEELSIDKTNNNENDKETNNIINSILNYGK